MRRLRDFVFNARVPYAAAFLLMGCGGTLSTATSEVTDAGPSVNDARPERDASIGVEDAGETVDDRVIGDGTPGPDEGVVGAGGCECRNLQTCCSQAAQIDNGVACRADVMRADQSVCRTVVLQGKYGCLALGFAPRCSDADKRLCPSTTTRCAACLTAIRNCGPVIQCVSDATCRPVWDSVVACDQAGRPFLECFQLLSSKGNVPGELVLLGAQCVDACQADR
jgi:hypothetical protein